MRSNWWPLASGIVLLIAHTPRVEAASFDCRKAANAVEITICSDEVIGLLDEQMATAYRNARERSSGSRALVEEQRAWLSERNACTTKTCLMRLYEQRIADLGIATSSIDTATARTSVTPSVSELPVESEAAILDDPIEQTDTAASEQTVDPAVGAPSVDVLEASVASAEVATPSPEQTVTATQAEPAPPPRRTMNEPASPPRAVSTAAAPADTKPTDVTADAPEWWRDYLPRPNERNEDTYRRHPTFYNWLAGYILVSGLFALMLVRPPLMRWYRSQYWFVRGTGPVDILLRKIWFRLGFELFIYALACVVGAIGGWLLIFFIRRGKQTGSSSPSVGLTGEG